VKISSSIAESENIHKSLHQNFLDSVFYSFPKNSKNIAPLQKDHVAETLAFVCNVNYTVVNE
jgi:hypothetical protein